MADEAGLHRTYVSAIERGERNVSLDNIEKLARALGTSIAQLFIVAESSYAALTMGSVRMMSSLLTRR